VGLAHEPEERVLPLERLLHPPPQPVPVAEHRVNRPANLLCLPPFKAYGRRAQSCLGPSHEVS
jgi:hypothetical protein